MLKGLHLNFIRLFGKNDLQADWRVRGIRYLGLRYSTKIADMVGENVGKLFRTTKQQLELWSKLKLCWFSRIAVMKMNVLPKFNLFFLHMLLTIPNNLINSIQMFLNRFIWCNKCPRIRARVMQQNTQEGGVGVPNIRELITKELNW